MYLKTSEQSEQSEQMVFRFEPKVALQGTMSIDFDTSSLGWKR